MYKNKFFYLCVSDRKNKIYIIIIIKNLLSGLGQK